MNRRNGWTRIRVGNYVVNYRNQFGGDQYDRANIRAIRLQLRWYRTTGEFVPPRSSEPGLDELGVRVHRVKGGAR